MNINNLILTVGARIMRVSLSIEENANKLGFDLLTQMLLYGRKHNIKNPVQYFALKLGYKAVNLLYQRMPNGDIGDMKVKDLITIRAIILEKREEEIEGWVQGEIEKLSRGLIYG